MAYHLLLRSSFCLLLLGHILLATLSNGLVSVVPRLQVAESGIRLFGGRGLCEICTIFWCPLCPGLISFSVAILVLPPIPFRTPTSSVGSMLRLYSRNMGLSSLDVFFHMASSALVCLSCFLYDDFRRSRSFVRAFFLL